MEPGAERITVWPRNAEKAVAPAAALPAVDQASDAVLARLRAGR